MRITNNMMVDSFLVNMQSNLNKMNTFTSQLSTGRKMVNLSDDPVGVFNSLTARQRLQRIASYQDSLVTARNWADQCESSLQELSAKMADIKEQLVYSATNIKTESDRQNIAVQMVEFRNTLKDALNSTMGDQYLFAGFNTVNEPITYVDVPDGQPQVLYNGIDLTDTSAANLASIQAEREQAVQLEVGYGLQMTVTMTAIDVVGIGENNLFQTVNNIIDALNSGSEDAAVVHELSGYIDQLTDQHSNVAACLVKMGAVTKQIRTLEDRYSQDSINYSDVRSHIEDIDTAEVVMDWKMAEAVYKQSLSTGARVIMPTLMDFLN